MDLLRNILFPVNTIVDSWQQNLVPERGFGSTLNAIGNVRDIGSVGSAYGLQSIGSPDRAAEPAMKSADEFLEAYNRLAAQNISEEREWSSAQAQKQMDFQERMANTEMQRRVEDLKAAGLNPALAYQLGGAAAPQGSMATSHQQKQLSRNDVLETILKIASLQNDFATSAMKEAVGLIPFR